jgi:hypothetical protein
MVKTSHGAFCVCRGFILKRGGAKGRVQNVSRIVDLEEGRLFIAAKKGYRNWVSHFGENFEVRTKLSDVSMSTLAYLAQGKDKGTFYLYDLIMNLEKLGSGFEFNELAAKSKMRVIDRYLFLLDRIRFDCMKRMGWIDDYPGEAWSIVELVTRFDELAPGLQAKTPTLSRSHTGYREFERLNAFDREAYVRRLIPKILQKIQD